MTDKKAIEMLDFFIQDDPVTDLVTEIYPDATKQTKDLIKKCIKAIKKNDEDKKTISDLRKQHIQDLKDLKEAEEGSQEVREMVNAVLSSLCNQLGEDVEDEGVKAKRLVIDKISMQNAEKVYCYPTKDGEKIVIAVFKDNEK